MKTKNKNLVYLALIFALILAFCGALLLSVFVGEKVAFADSANGVVENNLITDPVFDRNEWLRSGITILNPFTPFSFTSSSSWGTISFDLPEPLSLVSSTLTFSIYAKVRNGVGALNLRYRLGTSSATGFPGTITFNNSSYALYTYHIDLSAYSFTNLTHLYCCVYSRDPGSIIDVLWAKCEVGSSFTGYVPFNYNNFGYDQGSRIGYNEGFSSAVRTLSDFNYPVQSDMFVNLSSSSSIYTLIEGSYYTFSKITSVNSTTAVSEVGLNVGWKDIFVGMDWDTLSLSNVSFSWKIGTVAKTSNGLTYSTFNFVSSTPVFLPGNHLQLGASDPNSSRSYIQIDLFEDNGTITVPCFLSSYSSSDSVPNLYPLYQLTPLTFAMDSNLASSFLDGYNNGYRVATSTVIDTSASWSAGYNAGVSSVQNTTFDSLMSAVIDVPIRTIGGLLDFNFLGINLLQFIYSLLTLGIIIAIIRLCLGKS